MASWAATETTLRRLARPGNTHRGAGAFQRGERRQLMTAPRCRTAWGSSSRTAEGARVCCCVRAQVPTACAKVRHGEPGLLCQASANSSGALTWHNGHMDALADPAPPAKHRQTATPIRALRSAGCLVLVRPGLDDQSAYHCPEWPSSASYASARASRFRAVFLRSTLRILLVVHHQRM